MFEIGGSLREARLKRDLTPADVQKAIRIRDRYLQALEEERWELLPGDAYVKGFLRTYADYLGLDGNLYVEEYNSRFARPDEPQLVPVRFARTGTPLGRRLPAPARRRRRHRRDRRRRSLAAQRLLGRQAERRRRRRHFPTTTASHHPPGRRSTITARRRRSRSRPGRWSSRPAAARWLWIRSGSATGPTVYQGTLLQGKTLPVEPEERPGLDPDRRCAGTSTSGSAASSCTGCPTQVGNVLLTRRGIGQA